MSGAPLMEAALRWLAEHTPGAELLRLMDAPVPCGQSALTAGYGYCPGHPAGLGRQAALHLRGASPHTIASYRDTFPLRACRPSSSRGSPTEISPTPC